MDVLGLPKKIVSAGEAVYRLGDDLAAPLVDFWREQPKTTAVLAITAALATAAFRRNFMSSSDDAVFVSEGLTGVQSKVRLAQELPQVPGELSKEEKMNTGPRTFEEVSGLDRVTSKLEGLFRTSAGQKASLDAQADASQDALSRLGFPKLSLS